MGAVPIYQIFLQITSESFIERDLITAERNGVTNMGGNPDWVKRSSTAIGITEIF